MSPREAFNIHSPMSTSADHFSAFAILIDFALAMFSRFVCIEACILSERRWRLIDENRYVSKRQPILLYPTPLRLRPMLLRRISFFDPRLFSIVKYTV
jgi:hypothetical protein